MRLDEYLISEGLFPDKGTALRAVIAGEVLVDEVVASSAALHLKKDSCVRVKGQKKFVSRGGDKLQSAIEGFGVSIGDKRCIDIGSSTGGFTDCLLKNGARSVVCVDVNYGQLAWSIRTDPRTTVFERTNIKHASPEELGAPFDVVVIDVSFIGLAELAPYIASLCHSGSELLALVKPQFESRRGEAQGGVVLDPEIRMRTVEEVKDSLAEHGFVTHGVIESPVVGPAGNVEYLIYSTLDIIHR